ncbi:MAG: hybrid sensor histidine kinase/response regulator [Verrucomicrobia bacterium]|nr:MAG: hybrid sensor histidine kinase/response regulator [Verrucomicrobiota bacterium]
MRFEEGEQTTTTPHSSPSFDAFVALQLPQISDGNENARILSENNPPAHDNYLALVTRATNDAVRDWNVKSGTLCWPQGLQSLLGYDNASAESGKISFWVKNLYPGDRSRIAASIHEALNSSADHWSGEYRFRCASGNHINVLERALILRDENGNAERVIGCLMDVTARKQLHDQLCRSQKMEAFGQLAGGVAHDFNNFLTTILGYSDLLLGERLIKGALAEHITEIRAAAGRASGLTQQLLAFSRRQPLEPVIVEVNSIITNLERSLLRLIGENISVVCNLHHEKDGAHIKADPTQVTQIILNLAVNARDAMAKGGQLMLETAVVDLTNENSPTFHCGDLVPGQYVRINVIDNGTGMNEEVKAHLFEPFFTTKEDGRSGLGLATCYGIVHQSGGHLRAESEEGKGTTIEIYFPRVPAPPPPAYKKRGEKKVRGGTETILLLEDDVSVRHISVRVLRGLGYDVIEAASGSDARRLLSENGGRRVDLLLTDLVMPQTSGRRFADAFRAVHPNIKVVFISGYLEESLPAGERCEPGMFFLPKPFDAEQLAAKVREALDA